MNREEAIAEIRRRAQREHGTVVMALNRIFDDVLAGVREYVQAHADNPGNARHIGYLIGSDNTADLVEEALFDVFRVVPTSADSSPVDQLPSADRTVDLPQELWAAVMAVLEGHADPHERDAVRRELLTLGRESWHWEAG